MQPLKKLGNFTTKFFPISKNMRLDAIESIRNEYLNLLGIDGSEYEKYEDQVFVIDSSDVLNFKLIEDETEELDNDEEKDLITV